MSDPKSFTLIELLIVIGILAILVAAVVVTLNPAQLLAQARDSKRQQDLSALNQALNTITALDQSLFMGTSSIVYTSLPDSTTTCANWNLPSLPSGWQYHCAPTSTLQNTDGTGWIPVNFKTTGVVSLSSLPIDPINTSSTGLYYTYVMGGSFQLASHFESAKYQATEGSDAMYTVGSNTTLAPFLSGLVGWWPLNEGTGTIAYDRGGYGNNVTWTGTPAGTNGYYSPGKVSTWAGAFDGSTDYVNLGYNSAAASISNNITISAWINVSSTLLSSLQYEVVDKEYAYGLKLDVGGGSVRMEWDTSNDWSGPNTILSGLSANQWAFIAVSEDSSGNKNWYFNGFLIKHSIVSGTLTPSTYFLCIGAFGVTGCGGSNSWYNFPGLIEDVRIYNRALSASEIQALYNATK